MNAAMRSAIAFFVSECRRFLFSTGPDVKKFGDLTEICDQLEPDGSIMSIHIVQKVVSLRAPSKQEYWIPSALESPRHYLNGEFQMITIGEAVWPPHSTYSLRSAFFSPEHVLFLVDRYLDHQAKIPAGLKMVCDDAAELFEGNEETFPETEEGTTLALAALIQFMQSDAVRARQEVRASHEVSPG